MKIDNPYPLGEDWSLVIVGCVTRVLTLYPLASKTSYRFCASLFWFKSGCYSHFQTSKTNTNKFSENSPKTIKVNSLVCYAITIEVSKDNVDIAVTHHRGVKNYLRINF